MAKRKNHDPKTRKYEKHLQHVAVQDRLRTLAGQEIGPLPKVKSPSRRRRCKNSLGKFLETYFKHVFVLPWADYHLEIIQALENAILRSDYAAIAVPRGGGKSSIAEAAIVWALLYAHRKFPILIGATEAKATQRLKNIKAELRGNALLAEDFPEVCYPIRKLGRSARRCEGQKLDGKPTAMEWTSDHIVLPTVPRKPTSGSTVAVAGITGDIRGWSISTETLDRLRPDFAIADDVQTRESARSADQSNYRLNVLLSDVAYLAGPGQAMPVVALVTVVYVNDLADVLTDREANPQWRGIRHKMLPSLPANMDLWNQYAEVLRESQRRGEGPEAANQFYRDNRETMDEGAEASWAERFNNGELSAIQHGMNLKLRDEQAFQAECQNAPMEHADQDSAVCHPRIIIAKQHAEPRYRLPAWAEHVVASVDVQQNCLYYAVAGVSSDFQGAIVDYGAFPDQEMEYFGYRDVRNTLQASYSHATRIESQLIAGISDLTRMLSSHRYERSDGVPLSISQLLVDIGWQSDAIEAGIKQSESGIAIGSRGLGIGAKDTPIPQRKSHEGETIGHNWKITTSSGRATRHCQFDSNHWKSELHRCFRTALGEPGSWSLFRADPKLHAMFADHCVAEYADLMESKTKARRVHEWTLKPGRPDNHLLDCAVGCLVAASMEGCGLPGVHRPVEEDIEPEVYAELIDLSRL